MSEITFRTDFTTLLESKISKKVLTKAISLSKEKFFSAEREGSETPTLRTNSETGYWTLKELSLLELDNLVILIWELKKSDDVISNCLSYILWELVIESEKSSPELNLLTKSILRTWQNINDYILFAYFAARRYNTTNEILGNLSENTVVSIFKKIHFQPETGIARRKIFRRGFRDHGRLPEKSSNDRKIAIEEFHQDQTYQELLDEIERQAFDLQSAISLMIQLMDQLERERRKYAKVTDDYLTSVS